MKQSITAKEFFDKFIKSCDKNIAPNVYKNSTEYTYQVTQNICEILKDEGIRYNCEYYRIDVYGWDSVFGEEVSALSELTKKQRLGFHCWTPAIAIEHENNWAEWTDELVKLAYIRCPLKVIIAYNHTAETATHEREDRGLLEVAEKTLQKCAYYQDDKDDYLLIFGTSGKNAAYYSLNTDNKYEYRGYLYNREKEKFEQI